MTGQKRVLHKYSSHENNAQLPCYASWKPDPNATFQGPLFFNSLSPDIVSSVSVSIFKKNVKKHLLT